MTPINPELNKPIEKPTEAGAEFYQTPDTTPERPFRPDFADSTLADEAEEKVIPAAHRFGSKPSKETDEVPDKSEDSYNALTNAKDPVQALNNIINKRLNTGGEFHKATEDLGDFQETKKAA